ncbi:T3SS effector HopA1 family protein [Amycolatopsis solani]|uniref:T3SS effector HopA1 family protein n=1 Tax=Amycolatopsis solani TaxID=3028615 RepID=UPI0025AFE239|nr:T3SS effector HopA1 family protein [Amycolatopsis sp. MEP2-6]
MIVKAHRPDDRERVPRGRPATPVRHPEVAQLLRLNQLAGNAAVTSLVVQRVRLSGADETRIKSLKKADKKLAAAAKKRIKDFTSTDSGLWNVLSTFPADSKVPAPVWNEYLDQLYRALGEGASMGALTDLWGRLNEKYGERPPGKGGFVPSLDEVKTARGNLSSQPAKRVAEEKEKEKEKAPAAWTDFSPDARRQLMDMWAKWQQGGVDAKTFYDDFYKQSDVKQGMPAPSAGEYIDALDARKLRGSTSDEDIKNSRSGYPLQLADKGNLPSTRVYLNPHPRHIAEVYEFVKARIHPLPEVTWVKLADHARATTVRDVIVVYLSAKDAEKAVVDLLADYQRRYPGHFLDEVPRLTLRRLPGVGVGAEPPTPHELDKMLDQHFEEIGYDERQKHGRTSRQFSFSTYRSELVVRAIQDSGGVVARFQSLVADYFARAGIDLANPDRQGTPDPSVLPLLDMVWKYENVDT